VRIRATTERERAVELEQRLQEREGLDDIKLGRELEAFATREATLEAEQKALEDARLTVIAKELATDVKEADLDTRVVKLANREKRLVERHTQEMAAAQKRLEELQASQAGRARKVWDFLGQTEAALVPLVFSPLRSGLPAQEVDAVVPLLDSAGAKMSRLEEVVGGRLEEEGRALAEAVPEHVLLCFRSQDP
jgi:hypothetical protein